MDNASRAVGLIFLNSRLEVPISVLIYIENQWIFNWLEVFLTSSMTTCWTYHGRRMTNNGTIRLCS